MDFFGGEDDPLGFEFKETVESIKRMKETIKVRQERVDQLTEEL